MPRLPLIALNALVPGAGLLLVRPGLAPLLPALLGVAGLSVLGAALLAGDLPQAPLAGWVGLGLWAAAVLGTSLWWWAGERVRSRDLGAIRAAWRDAAERYLRDDLRGAVQAARRLTALAPAEPGAWRLLELVATAGGDARLAATAAARAAALG